MSTEADSISPSTPRSDRKDVVVGFDGSPAASAAVEWGAREALRRSSGLRIVTAAHYTGMATATGAISAPAALMPQDEPQEGRRVAAKVLDERRITTRASVDSPAAALVSASRDAAMVVVGHRSRNALASVVLGSVALTVVAHAECPVIIIRDQVEPGRAPDEPGRAPDRPVVVGVDGSEASMAAVAFAAELAAELNTSLHLVSAWHRPPATGYEYAYWSAEAEHTWSAELAAGARSALAEGAKVAGRLCPQIVVEREVAQGTPAEMLLKHAPTSALLVVGRRGRGGFARLLLGSVSHAVIHAASCPVAVVPR